jgi:lysophospholipase L1-like esterase
MSWATQIEQDRGAVVFVGDSLFANWADDLPNGFPGMKVANRAIPRDTTRGVLSRLPEDVLVLDPAAVVVLVGGEDPDPGASPADTAGNMALIVAALQKHKPTMPVVICQVLPATANTNRPVDRIKELNMGYLDAIVNRPGVTYVETWSLFADSEGRTRQSEFPEGLRPNDIAYEKLAAALRPVFSTLGVLKETPDDFTPEPRFVSLFNGLDLTGWGYRPIPEEEIAAAKRRDASSRRPPVRVYPAEAKVFDGASVTPEGRYLVTGGKLVVTTPPEHRKIQQLWTQQEFAKDFVLKLEFRATPNADSGVYVRGPQLQVRDYLVAGPYKELKNYRPQDWNELVITVRGEVALCTCNGEVIEAAFKVPASGPIGLEGDRGQMEFRRIRIRIIP